MVAWIVPRQVGADKPRTFEDSLHGTYQLRRPGGFDSVANCAGTQRLFCDIARATFAHE